jgi:ribosomal protein S24E
MSVSKQNKLLAGALIIGVAIIIFSLYWPPVDRTDTSGTFARSDKYKDTTVKNDDIILRSEILTDTIKTKQIIKDLVQFADFTIYVKSIINEWWIPVLQKYHSSPDINDAVGTLNEYSQFIENNNSLVAKTIITLGVYYADSKTPVTEDVESQIKQFYNYAGQFIARDSIFEQTISRIDNSIKNDKMRAKEISALKELRDRIVLENFMFGIVSGDKDKIAYSSAQVLNDPKKMLELFNSWSINSAASNISNNSIIGIIANQINSNSLNLLLFSSEKINSAMNQIKSFANQANFGFMWGMSPQSYNLLIGNNNSNLNLFSSINAVNSAANNVTLGNLWNQQNLGCALNKENLGLIIMNADKFNAAMNQMNLGMFNQNNLGTQLFNNFMIKSAM